MVYDTVVLGGVDKWGEVTRLAGSDTTSYDGFGRSVGLCDDTIVIGAGGDNILGNFDQGSVYIFERDEGGTDNWGQVKKLTASDGADSDHFGNSVSISGDTVVVGANDDDVAGSSERGSAYIFKRNQGGTDNWGQVKKLTASDGSSDDRFGWSVSVSGDTIVVGAYFKTIGANIYQGAAYIYERDYPSSDSWGEKLRLTASDPGSYDRFGGSVCVDRDLVAVGAKMDTVGPVSAQGSVHVFGRDHGGTGVWGQVKTLHASDAIEDAYFGSAVGVFGDHIVVGASDHDVDGQFNQGKAYLYEKDHGGSGQWGEVASYTATDGEAADSFGEMIAIYDDVVVVGADTDNHHNEADPGSAYVFYTDMEVPSITDTTMEPAYTGDTHTFKADVTDNREVSQVTVEYWYGTGDHMNITLEDSGGDVFSRTIQVENTTEVLYYRISANDTATMNNWHSLGTLDLGNVIDNDDPFIVSDDSPAIGTTGDLYAIDITAFDNIAMDRQNVQWVHGGLGEIRELNDDGDGTWSLVITLDHDLEYLEYTVQLIDTSGNDHFNETVMVPVSDNDDPILELDDSPGMGTTGDPYVFDITALDNIEVTDVMALWAHGELGGNDSMTDNGDGTWSLSIDLDHDLVDLEYSVRVTDSSGNNIIQPEQAIPVADNDAPEIKAISEPVTGSTGGSVNVSYQVMDNIGVTSYQIDISGSTLDLEKNGDHYNSTIDIPLDSTEPIPYFCTFRDEAGYEVVTGEKVIVVTDDVPPMAEAGENRTGKPGEQIQFDGNGSMDNIGIVAYTWTFEYDGDKVTLSEAGPTHTFDVAGEFVVTLTVADEVGNIGTDVVIINITGDGGGGNVNGSETNGSGSPGDGSNDPGSGGSGSGVSGSSTPLWIIPLIVVVIAVVIVVMVLLVLLSRRKPEDENGTAAPTYGSEATPGPVDVDANCSHSGDQGQYPPPPSPSYTGYDPGLPGQAPPTFPEQNFQYLPPPPDDDGY